MLLQKIWDKNPIFYLSLYITLGVAAALKPHYIYFLPVSLLLLFSRWKWRGISFFFIGFCHTHFIQPKLPLLNEEISGKGKFILQAITPSQTPFSRGYCIKGTLREFQGENTFFPSLPCTIFLDQKMKIPEGKSWIIEGMLSQKSSFNFIFKPLKKNPWKIAEKGFSLARSRFIQKEKIRSFFQTRIKEKPVAHLFSILATGDIDDHLLANEFQKLGLGHILAISGLHFALIALVLGKILQWFFSPSFAFLILFIFLGLFCLFLGASPSILRAFIMISLWILSLLLKREAKGLNLLGCALLLELIMNPLSLTSLGFQLSFLATTGIFLYYPFFHTLFEKLLPKRKYSSLLMFSKTEQHIYIFLNSMRSALSLNAAVHTATLLPLLYLFASFPLLSFAYNLFAPSLLMISMLLIPFGLLFPPLETLNVYFTKFILQLISNPPEIINYTFHIPPISFTLFVFLVSGIFFGGCFLLYTQEN